jgi:hypothetical protein
MVIASATHLAHDPQRLPPARVLCYCTRSFAACSVAGSRNKNEVYKLERWGFGAHFIVRSSEELNISKTGLGEEQHSYPAGSGIKSSPLSND